MTQFTIVEIDVQVHKAIELARQSFGETPNDILKRMLRITNGQPIEDLSRTDKAAWSGKGVTLPHGTLLDMTYNGVTHKAIIDNGRWKIGGEFFKSPSDAASGVSKLVTGDRKNLNGWIYWIARPPELLGAGKKLSDMRQLAERKAQDRNSLRTR